MIAIPSVFLLRHGQTRWNREEIYRGQADIPLDARGREQARCLGEVLGRQGLREPLLVASPLQRATETAGLVAQIAFSDGDVPVKSDRAFLDLSYGEWEGLPRSRVEQEYPELHRRWLEAPGTVRFPGGEDLATVAGRAQEGLLHLLRANPGRDLVIVAHRAVNKALLCRLLGAGMDSFWKIRQDTACLNLLEWRGDHLVVIKLNDTCHLEALGQDQVDF